VINTGVDDVTRRWTLRLVAGLAAGAVVLSGCSERQEAADTLPGADAEPSATEAELPPLGPSEFPVPDAARERTPEGALEFTRYYVKLNGHIASGPLNPQPLLDLSQDCRQCIAVAQSYADDRAAGYTYDQFTYKFTPAGPGLIEDDIAQVGFVYEQGPLNVLDGGGNRVAERSSSATGRLQSGTTLAWDSSRTTWIVTGLTIG
jgi:hypothetical protein